VWVECGWWAEEFGGRLRCTARKPTKKQDSDLYHPTSEVPDDAGGRAVCRGGDGSGDDVRDAGAAFPGENGKIVYEDLVLSTFDYEISVMNPDGSGRTNLTNGGDEEKAPPSRGFAGRARQDSNLRPPDS
jgi:hypothetical protein